MPRAHTSSISPRWWLRSVTVAVTVAALTATGGITGASVAFGSVADEGEVAADAVAAANPEAVGAAVETAFDEQTQQVTVTSLTGTPIMDVTLPVTESPDVLEENGLLVIESERSAIVPVATDEGSLAIHSVLYGPDSPSDYRYEFDLGAEETIELAPDGQGFLIRGAEGTPILFGAPPWARDATGATVATRYRVEGNAIVQEVDHTAGDYSYPIVADPWMGNTLISSWRWETTTRILVTPTQYSRGWAGNFWWIEVGNAGYAELRSKQPYSYLRDRLNKSGQHQYVCHVGYAPFKATWNLETNKADKGLAGFIAGLCN